MIYLTFLLIGFLGTYTMGMSERATEKNRIGSIKGQLKDSDTRAPLAAALVSVKGTAIKTLTNEDGNFSIPGIAVGSYTLVFTYPRFAPLTKPDIIVKSNRITFIDVKMALIPLASEEVTVTAGYFPRTPSTPKSKVNFSHEDIRRTAGAAGDVSRVMLVLPGVSKIGDFFNSLVVRGGNPAENTFYIDNIEITNINHFPVQGSSGGPIGLLNLDFIEDVDFYLGGFSAIYGDRLSSIMDIRFREGNRDEFDIQLDLNMGGFGAVMEGPLPGKGSWIFSARKSYLDLLVDAIGTGVAPRYSDAQGKLVFDLSPKSKISFLGVLGIDHITFSREDQLERGDPEFGTSDNREYTLGLNWFQIWNDKGYSNTSISHSFTKYENLFHETASEDLFLDNISNDQSFTFRNVNHYTFNHHNKVEFGMEIKHLRSDYDYRVGERFDFFGHFVPEVHIRSKVNATKSSGFINYRLSVLKPFTVTLGLRADYFSYNKNFHLSPRFTVTAKPDDKISIYGSAGIFYQNLPLILLCQQEANRELKDLKAYHYSLGMTYLLTASTQLTLEVYDKEYRNFPVDPAQGTLFISDSFQYERVFFQHDILLDTGKAYSRGIEFILQKKLRSKIYGMISGSLFRTRYKDFYGQWRDRLFDNRYNFAVQGGYKPNKKWEFSIRWIIAGGIPYTPYNIDASEAVNSGILDRGRIQAERLGAYNSLNLRTDRRFYFKKSNLIVFLSIWNVYNRKNVARLFWNNLERKPDQLYSWGFLPIAGLEFEF